MAVDKEKLKEISKIFSQMSYVDWSKIKQAIEQKYSSEIAKVKLGTPEELINMLELECL